MKNPFCILVNLIDSLEEDFKKYYEQGDLAAGNRISKGARKLKFHAVRIREEIQDAKDKLKVVVNKSDSESTSLDFNSNRFKQVVQEVPHYVYLSKCQSYFTDEEAIRLCSNMTCSVPRKAAQEIKKIKVGSLSYKKCRYELHYLANKALSIYGANVLTFVYNLNQLDFADSSSAKLKQVVSSKSFDYATVDFPTLTFTTADFYEYSLIFSYDETLSSNELRRSPQVKIYSRTYGTKIGHIDKTGSVVNTLERASVKLDLFLSTIKDGKGFELRLGVANGNCIICGAELKNSASKRRGIGPDCLRQL